MQIHRIVLSVAAGLAMLAPPAIAQFQNVPVDRDRGLPADDLPPLAGLFARMSGGFVEVPDDVEESKNAGPASLLQRAQISVGLPADDGGGVGGPYTREDGFRRSRSASGGVCEGPKRTNLPQPMGRGFRRVQPLAEPRPIDDIPPDGVSGTQRRIGRGSFGGFVEEDSASSQGQASTFGGMRRVALPGPTAQVRTPPEDDENELGDLFARMVTLQGRSGSVYTMIITSAQEPDVVLHYSRGHLFGIDPDDEPRTIYMRVPVGWRILLIPG